MQGSGRHSTGHGLDSSGLQIYSNPWNGLGLFCSLCPIRGGAISLLKLFNRMSDVLLPLEVFPRSCKNHFASLETKAWCKGSLLCLEIDSSKAKICWREMPPYGLSWWGDRQWQGGRGGGRVHCSGRNPGQQQERRSLPPLEPPITNQPPNQIKSCRLIIDTHRFLRIFASSSFIQQDFCILHHLF